MLPSTFWIENLDDFLGEVHLLPKKNDICIIILNYNNKEFILKLAKILDKIKSCDIVIVDNNSNDGSYEELLKYYGTHFNLLQTKQNYGGAGGFGIGIQWVIERGYDYCFVSEEDALPLAGNEDIFEKMLEYKEHNTIVVAKFYELMTDSFTLHYHIYPVWILKMVGTLNIELFFRADDWEWGTRIENCIQKNNLNIHTKVVDRYYTHPLVKKGFGLFANYFSIRNSFFVYLKYPRRNFLIDYIENFTKYCSYGIFTLIYDKNYQPLIQFIYAYMDFVLDDMSKNELRIKKFKNFSLEPKSYSLDTLTFDEFYQCFKNKKIISSSLHNPHFNKYTFAKSSKNGVISVKFNGISRLKAFWFKDIIFIEDIDFINKEVTYFKYDNTAYISSRVKIIFSVFLSLFFLCLTIPIVFYKKLRTYEKD